MVAWTRLVKVKVMKKLLVSEYNMNLRPKGQHNLPMDYTEVWEKERNQGWQHDFLLRRHERMDCQLPKWETLQKRIDRKKMKSLVHFKLKCLSI